jgi:methylphosphotriester-DNA--protein-cysteine methyltransferase
MTCSASFQRRTTTLRWSGKLAEIRLGRQKTRRNQTPIYCRPVCPTRHAHSKNVEYYPSAAAAEAAGYRPCLRCRPETAPFSPAWKGSVATVERAVRLVNEGALDNAGVEAFAGRLGIGGRHLLRLFKKHVGASPTQVAQTARVQRAKRLIDNTNLPMTEIALRSARPIASDGVPLWTETACRFPPKPPAGLNRNRLSETPKFAVIEASTTCHLQKAVPCEHSWTNDQPVL